MLFISGFRNKAGKNFRESGLILKIDKEIRRHAQ